MAATEFGTNDAQTRKVWGLGLAREAIGKLYLRRFMGKGKNAIIRIKDELEKGAGDEIRHNLRVRMTGPGKTGSSRLKGNEEALDFYQDTLKINQLRNAHVFDQMSQQRTVHSLRNEAREGISDWFGEVGDSVLAAKLAGTIGSGLEVGVDPAFDGNALRAPDAAHNVVKSSDAMEVNFIDLLVNKAKTLRPRIRPARIDGKNYYVLLLHPHSVYSLRTKTGDTEWKMIQARAAEMGSKNPIFSGALGIWNGVVLHEWEYVPYLSNGANSLAYNLFLGAQAGCIAFGRRRRGSSNGRLFSWYEEMDDYGDKEGVAGATIMGCQKSTFNSLDFATIRLDTNDVAPS